MSGANLTEQIRVASLRGPRAQRLAHRMRVHTRRSLVLVRRLGEALAEEERLLTGQADKLVRGSLSDQEREALRLGAVA